MGCHFLLQGGLPNPGIKHVSCIGMWILHHRTTWEANLPCPLASQSCLTLCDPVDCSTPGFTVSKSLLKLISIELVMLSNHLILCCPIFLLPSIFPSISISSKELALHIRWPNWSFSFSIRPSNEYSGLVFFRIDWLDLLAVQGILKFSSTTIQKHQFFYAQPSLWSSSHIFV